MTGLLFLLSFALYLSGLSGTVPSYRDSGDLIASIHTLGIAHPPGYALYVLLGKLFETVLPFGNAAYRVNVLSALFAAAAVATLMKLLSQIYRIPWLVAVAVAVLYGTASAMVSLARVAEMYTLEAFLASAILYGLLLGKPKGTSMAALLLGLGLSVHPTLIFLVPAFVGAWSRRDVGKSESRDEGRFPTPLLLFLLGLTVFLYLPIRASQHPLLNWGDPSSWRNFWRVVTRADYGGLKLHPEQSSFSWTAGSIVSQWSYLLAALNGEFGWGALGLGGAGLLIGLKSVETRRMTLGVLGSWVLAGPAFFMLSNLPLHESTTPAILQPYLLLVGLLWVPFLGTALRALFDRDGPQWRRPLSIAAVLSLLLLTRSWSFPSQRYDFYAYDYARNLLRSLPRNAVLYDPDDPTHFSIQVLQTVEHRRTDVALLNFFRTRWGYEQIKRQWPDLLPPIPIENSQELQRLLWSYSARQRPFYAELPQKLSGLGIPYHAEGLAYAADIGNPRPGLAPSLSRWEREPGGLGEGSSFQRAETMLQLYVMRGDYVTTHHPDFFTKHLIDYYAAAHCNLGLDYASAGKPEKAIAHYRAALAMNPQQSAAYNDWGIVAYQHQRYAEAADLFQKGLAVDPGNQNLQKNADLALQKMRKLI